MEQHREDRDDAGLYNGTAFGMQQKTVIADLIESKGTEWIGKVLAIASLYSSHQHTDYSIHRTMYGHSLLGLALIRIL